MARITITVDGNSYDFPDELLPDLLATYGTEDPRVPVAEALKQWHARVSDDKVREAQGRAEARERKKQAELYGPLIEAFVATPAVPVTTEPEGSTE